MDAKAFPHFPDLRPESFRIGRVPSKDFNGHGAAIGAAQQPVDDLRAVALAIAVVPELNQLRALAGVVAAGYVVEDQRSVGQMLVSELCLDTGLMLQQPVQRLVQFILVDAFKLQLVRQARRGCLLLKCSRRRELGRGLKNTRNDHGNYQAALSTRPRREEVLQPQLPQRAQDRRDVAVWQRADDL